MRSTAGRSAASSAWEYTCESSIHDFGNAPVADGDVGGVRSEIGAGALDDVVGDGGRGDALLVAEHAAAPRTNAAARLAVPRCLITVRR
jgi:hypothetical protein